MEWGKSDLYHTTRLLDESHEIRDCTVATVINKVDFRVMSTYEPSTIDSKYLERYCTSKSRREAILEKDQTLKTFVYDRLAEVWTPEQISGWLKGRTEPRLRAVGHETIYAFIYRAAQKAERLWRYLTRHHKR